MEDEHINHERDLTKELYSASRKEEELGRLKSRSLRLKAWDMNIAFSHKQARARELKIWVKETTLEGRPRLTSFEYIKMEAFNYFHPLYNVDQIPLDKIDKLLQVIPKVI